MCLREEGLEAGSLKQKDKMYPEKGRTRRPDPWGIDRACAPDFSLGVTPKNGRGQGEGLKSDTRVG